MALGSRTLVAAMIVLALGASACDLPTLREARSEAAALPQTSFLYAADGTLITRLHAGEDRVAVRQSRIPDVVRNAVIAIEDQRFYDHAGLDLRAVLRAAYVDVTTGEIVEGGSTITQQLVKKVYVGEEETLTRKLKEAYLAWQLEHRLTKSQILTKYLNTVYFGNGAYGIMAASRTYFSKQPEDLNVEGSALLAGLIAAPVDYDPVTHPNRARNRRNRVLGRMLDLGMIDPIGHQVAVEAPISLSMDQEETDPYPPPPLPPVPAPPPHRPTPWVRACDGRRPRLLGRGRPVRADQPRDRWQHRPPGGICVQAVRARRRARERAHPNHVVERLFRAHLAPRRDLLGPEERRGRRLRDDLARDRHGELREHRLREPALGDGRRRPVRRRREDSRGGRAVGDPLLPSHDRAQRPARARPLGGPRCERGQHARDGLCLRDARVRRPARPADPRHPDREGRRRDPLRGEPESGAGRRTRHRRRGGRHPLRCRPAGNGKGREPRPAAVRQDGDGPERERRLVRGSHPPDGGGRMGRLPSGADPDVLRQRPDLDRVRRDVAGGDLARVHGERDEADARDRLPGGSRGRVRDAPDRRHAGLSREHLYPAAGHRHLPVRRGDRTDPPRVHRAHLVPAAPDPVRDRPRGGGSDRGSARGGVQRRHPVHPVRPAGRNRHRAGPGARGGSDPDGDRDDHDRQGRALARAEPRAGPQRPRHEPSGRHRSAPPSRIPRVRLVRRGVRPGGPDLRIPSGRGLVPVPRGRHTGRRGIKRLDRRQPVAGRPGDTNGLSRTKNRHRRSTPTVTPTRVLRAIARAGAGSPDSR